MISRYKITLNHFKPLFVAPALLLSCPYDILFRTMTNISGFILIPTWAKIFCYAGDRVFYLFILVCIYYIITIMSMVMKKSIYFQKGKLPNGFIFNFVDDIWDLPWSLKVPLRNEKIIIRLHSYRTKLSRRLHTNKHTQSNNWEPPFFGNLLNTRIAMRHLKLTF